MLTGFFRYRNIQQRTQNNSCSLQDSGTYILGMEEQDEEEKKNNQENIPRFLLPYFRRKMILLNGLDVVIKVSNDRLADNWQEDKGVMFS